MSTKYSIKVNYEYSLQEMLEVGNYADVGTLVKEGKFSFDVKNDVKNDIELISFDDKKNTSDILKYFKDNSLQQCNLAELFAFGASYPEEQLHYPIVALGSHYIDSDPKVLKTYYPALWESNGGRAVYAYENSGVWSTNNLFFSA